MSNEEYRESCIPAVPAASYGKFKSNIKNLYNTVTTELELAAQD